MMIAIKCVILLIHMLVSRLVNCQLLPDIDDEHTWKCERITVPYCQSIGYNQTRMPNLAGNSNQEVATVELRAFLSLVQSGCSKQVQLFLCTIYTPYCTEQVEEVVHPCRPFCEEVRDSCLPLMRKFGFSWPKHFNCSRFPVKNNGNTMCNEGLPGRRRTDIPSLHTSIARPKTPTFRLTSLPSESPSLRKSTPFTKYDHIQSYKKICRASYLRIYRNYFYVERIRSCALGCELDGMFSSDEKIVTSRWIAVLSFSCLILTLIGLSLTVINLENTVYPERAIFLINGCFWFYSLAYILVVTFSRQTVSCDTEHTFNSVENRYENRSYILKDGSGHLLCAATFLLSYCFSMAQTVWWVILTLTWFLSAGLGWKSDTIRRCSTYFHVASWAVPSAKTIIILVLKKIDVDELTGICYVGNRMENLGALRGFIVGPLFTYLLIGTTFLLAGITAVLRAKGVNSNSHGKIDQSLLRVGVYATIHTLLTTFITASYFYEYVNKESWFLMPNSSGPNFEVFLLRHILYFMVGIFSSLWICFNHFPSVLQRISRGNKRDRLNVERSPFRVTNNETPL